MAIRLQAGFERLRQCQLVLTHVPFAYQAVASSIPTDFFVLMQLENHKAEMLKLMKYHDKLNLFYD